MGIRAYTVAEANERRRRITGDEDYAGDDFVPGVGVVNTFANVPEDADKPKRRRAFPPGFHGANPGPSHEDEEKPVRRRRKA